MGGVNESMSDAKLLWWGYLHVSDTLHVKRYFGPLDIREANESPFVKVAYGPFEASGRDEALTILQQKINGI